MNDEQGYNGWKNYETWAVGLYLDGNYDGENTYRMVLELASAASGRGDLADALKGFVEESLPDLGSSLASDLLGAAVGSVDWFTLAEHKLAEVREAAEHA